MVLINNDDEDKFMATLNRDVELVKLENGAWDIKFESGDISLVKGHKSLHNGIIIALLMGYNELKKKGNLIYEDKGNKAYEVLKENKTEMTAYKIECYFIEVLEDIRRIKSIDNLEVMDSERNNFAYYVFFKVIAHDDTTVEGGFDFGQGNETT